MAGYIPNLYRATLLEVLAGRTAASTATVYLGLATSLANDPQTTTLANMVEVTTAGYARKAIPAFSAAGNNPPQITTPTTFSFNALTADMLLPANWAFITNGSSGTGGDLRYIFDLADAVLGRNGEPINIPASSLIIE